MTVQEYVSQSLRNLSETELTEVAEYLAFLRFRARAHVAPPFDAAQAASLYAKFAEEDRTLAEEGMGEYVKGLAAEDAQ